MSDNSWPDPVRPGVPTDPGHHWLYDGNYYAVEWTGTHWIWLERKTSPKKMIALEFKYCGPCLTPPEVNNLRAALEQARRDALEEAAQYHDKLAAAQQQMSEVPVDEFLTAVWKSSAEKHRHYAAAIRALADNE
jgi:hypothetical protein